MRRWAAVPATPSPRRRGSLAITETFKQKKQGLAQDGFNPYASGDLLYADCGQGVVSRDAALYARISSGLMRL